MEPIRSQEEVASLYQRHVDMVYQICLMLMKNVPDAEDAVQTVFRKVMEYPKPFRDPEHERAWLIVTARNECRNQLKHWWRTRRESEEVFQGLTWEQIAERMRYSRRHIIRLHGKALLQMQDVMVCHTPPVL